MRYICCILLLIIEFSCTNKDDVLIKAIEISQEIGSQLAPDSREAIYTTSFSFSDDGLVVHGETSLPKVKLALFSNLKSLKVHLIDDFVLLPEEKLGEKNWGLVNLSVVNLRSKPKHSSELVSQAILGTPVRVLKENGSWYLVQTPDNYIAWLDAAALSLKSKEEMAAWRNSKRIVFTPSFEIVKGINGDVVTDVVAGSILEIEKNESYIYRLKLPDGRLVKLDKNKCIEFDNWKQNEIKESSILTKTAKEFIGRPYLWGGTSSKGVDCSGFVKSVYFMNGIILARDASLQFLHGDSISPKQTYKELKEGDLVFFGKKASNKTDVKVTHVGMYMKNGEYIHSSGRVKINSFDPEADNFNNYRSISWLGGRRVLNRIGDAGIIRVAEHPWY